MRTKILGGLVVLQLIMILGWTAKSDPQLQQSGGSGGSANITQFGGTNVSLGQKAMSASLPMVIASDQGALPENQTQIGGVTIATGNGVVGTGVQRVAIASDNTAFSVNATVASALPAGTNVIGTVKQIPLHGCTGNTLQDITTVDVATGGGTAATAADTCVFYVYANNKTASAVTLTIQDKSGTPIVYSTTFSIPGNSDVRRDFGGHKFLGGVQLIAGTGSAVNTIVYGVQ